MKSIKDFKIELVEEEKSDYSKFDVLVRAGLANKAQMQRIHRILDKMQDDRPNFNNADKQIIQNLFNKMVDLVSNNKQIFQQTRRAVREDLEEGVVDTSDYKVDSAGRKYKAHRTKVGDTAPQVGDDPDAIKEEAIQLDESKEPPFVLVLKRKAIRVYPDGTKIALYYNDRLKRIFNLVKDGHNENEHTDYNRKNFAIFVDEHDRRRGTNFLETFPELGDFYTMCKSL
jgi:hypothetical protein